MNGPDIITGGLFGAEASVIAVCLGAAVSVLFISLHFKKIQKAEIV